MPIFSGLLGGLGLFLYGISKIGDGLEKTVGEKMKMLIEIHKNNRFMAMLSGVFVTMIIQSSTATTVMVVGFVNTGIMTLTQAAGVIMGANIGTTITAQIAALNLSNIVIPLAGIGAIVWLFSKDRKTRNVMEIPIGLGLFFLGLEFMKVGVVKLQVLYGFMNLIHSLGSGSLPYSLLAIFIGFGLTVIIKSSSATLGVLIALASQGMLPIEAAIPIILGTNIGTCVTAMISSIGANRTAKRAAFIHMIFNLIGTFLFILFFTKLTIHLVRTISFMNPSRELANAHTLFNVLNTIILLPFTGILVKISTKVIPIKDYEKTEIRGIKYLDDRILQTPSIAIIQVIKETLNMGEVAFDTYNKAMDAILNKDENLAHEAFAIEKITNKMERTIAEYLVKLSNTALSAKQYEMVNGLISTINDIERVGDHSDNIAELALYVVEHDLSFSKNALEELNYMGKRVVKSYTQALQALQTGDIRLAKRVIEREGEIDLIEKTFRKNHIARLNHKQCNPESGVIFLDIISNLERIGDHSKNIAFSVLDSSK